MHFATFFPSLLEFSSRNAFYEPRLDTKQAQTIRIPWKKESSRWSILKIDYTDLKITFLTAKKLEAVLQVA